MLTRKRICFESNCGCMTIETKIRRMVTGLRSWTRRGKCPWKKPVFKRIIITFQKEMKRRYSILRAIPFKFRHLNFFHTTDWIQWSYFFLSFERDNILQKRARSSVPKRINTHPILLFYPLISPSHCQLRFHKSRIHENIILFQVYWNLSFQGCNMEKSIRNTRQ
jgi:hypothetical protein